MRRRPKLWSLAVAVTAAPLALTVGATPGHAQTQGDGTAPVSVATETSVEVQTKEHVLLARRMLTGGAQTGGSHVFYDMTFTISI